MQYKLNILRCMNNVINIVLHIYDASLVFCN